MLEIVQDSRQSQIEALDLGDCNADRREHHIEVVSNKIIWRGHEGCNLGGDMLGVSGILGLAIDGHIGKESSLDVLAIASNNPAE